MSLVTVTFDNSPFLLSDVLITATDNQKDVEFPLFLNTVQSLFSDANLYPDSLRQKSIIISDKLAIGMAGYVSEMKNLLGDIRQYFKFYPATFDTLQKFLDSYDKESFSQSSCCFLLCDDRDGKINFYVKSIGSWKSGKGAVFGDILATGTGSERIIQEMAAVDRNYTRNQNISHLQRAVATHCIMVCKLIGSEFFSASTLKDFWGGAFELVGFDGRKFAKVDDIGYLVWDCRFDEKGNLQSEPRIAVDYKYYDNVLVLTVNNFVSIKRYGILALDQKVEEVDTSLIPNCYRFSSKKISCCYRVTFPKGKIKISSFFYQKLDEEAEDIISVKLLPSGHSQVAVQTKFENRMIADIKQDILNGNF